MSHVKIEWLQDTYDCGACGVSYAEGARITITNQRGRESVIEFLPVAHCFDGQHWERDHIWRAVLAHMGHQVEEVDER